MKFKMVRGEQRYAMAVRFAKFERQELALQNADRNERAERLRLPVTKEKEKSGLRAYEHQ